MAKSYVEMEKMMGSRVKIPDENSPAEERSAFYAKLGRPQNPESYDLGLPEDTPVNPAIMTAIQQSAFDLGVSQTQLQGIIKSYFDTEKAELIRSFDEGQKALQEKFPTDWEANVKIGQRAIRELSGEDYREELVNLIDKTPIGNHPAFIQFLTDIGKKTLPDTLVTGKQVTGGEGKDYKPAYPNSPSQYADDDTEEGKKARAWFMARGHTY
jgi:hypothetical protein